MSNQILQDASPDDLRLAIEQNNIDLFYAAAAAGGATILSEAGVSGVMAKPWWPSFLFDPSFSNEDVSGQLELLRLRIVEDGWPAVLKFGPKGKPTDLERDLSRSGFVAMDHRPPGMATCLSTANDDHYQMR